MRTIKLKTVEAETGAKLNYVELCGACLKARAPHGFSIEEMRIRLEAIKEFPTVPMKEGEADLTGLAEEIKVSEETAQELLKCTRVFRWSMVDQVIIDFVDHIEETCGNKKK